MQSPDERRAYYREWKARKLAEDPEYFRQYAKQYRTARPDKRRAPQPPDDEERARRRAWYAAHREERLAKAKAWREANREKVREYYRDYYARDPERARARSKREYERSKDRRAGEMFRRYRTKEGIARMALGVAVKHGVVVKPEACQRCGSVVSKRHLHGHHHDYDRPLDVEWICSLCHGKEHRKQ